MMHAAYTAGLIDRGSDMLNTARLYMAQGAPYPAAELIREAMESGKVDESADNLQLLGQALALAKEYKAQIPVLKKAAQESESGKQYMYLGQAQVSLYEWEGAADSFRKALNYGGLDDRGSVYMQLGTAYFNLDNFSRALEAFRRAARYDSTEDQADQWIRFVNQEIKRQKAMQGT